MKKYCEMNREELNAEYLRIQTEYEKYKTDGRKVVMARGNLHPEQMEICMPMLDIVNSRSDCHAENGVDCRNYGETAGIVEARRLFAEYMGIAPSETIVTGCASTHFIFDCLSRAMLAGTVDSDRPWCKEEKVKWLCLVPGYDKHFNMTEFLGFELVTAPLTENGPDMDIVEKMVANDPQIKGMWCVPKYSNPYGCTYSDECVRRLASMKTAAKDFRIIWDNAYAYHYIYKMDPLLNILDECKKAGNPNRVYIFGSTSKITFATAGVSFFGASEENVQFTLKQIFYGLSSYDKMNMLRHVRFLKNMDHLKSIMDRHAAILRPKFDTVISAFENELAPRGIGKWIKPNGGYFITLKAENHCARKIEQLCSDAGLTITRAGATHPHYEDPEDAYLRIAPSMPSVDDLEYGMKILCLAVRLTAVEQLMKS